MRERAKSREMRLRIIVFVGMLYAILLDEMNEAVNSQNRGEPNESNRHGVYIVMFCRLYHGL